MTDDDNKEYLEPYSDSPKVIRLKVISGREGATKGEIELHPDKHTFRGTDEREPSMACGGCGKILVHHMAPGLWTGHDIHCMHCDTHNLMV